MQLDPTAPMLQPSGSIAVIGNDGKVLPRPASGTIIFGATRTRSVAPDLADYDLGIVVAEVPDVGPQCSLQIVWGRREKSFVDGTPIGEFELYGAGRPTAEGWGRDFVHVWRRLAIVGSAVIDSSADEVVIEWWPHASTPQCFYNDGEARVLAAQAQRLFAEGRSPDRGAKRQRVQSDAAAAVPSQMSFTRVPFRDGGGGFSGGGSGSSGVMSGAPILCHTGECPPLDPTPENLKQLEQAVPRLRRTIVGSPTDGVSRRGMKNVRGHSKARVVPSSLSANALPSLSPDAILSAAALCAATHARTPEPCVDRSLAWPTDGGPGSLHALALVYHSRWIDAA